MEFLREAAINEREIMGRGGPRRNPGVHAASAGLARRAIASPRALFDDRDDGESMARRRNPFAPPRLAKPVMLLGAIGLLGTHRRSLQSSPSISA